VAAVVATSKIPAARTGACSKKVNAASSHTFSGLVAVFAEIPSTNAHCSCRARFLA
jgi:hypothetical protein